ncbi:putative alpha-1,2-mannosyltransferase [Fragilariopsis cylindrus CCMP1102]|uniref:Mannosyltransferase n=1 Tax=Fragilariopsis cylindrus CCMP1102 TaxID=635003 RepID=A0A1E7ER87_9STRA|nr:putative alpha-1,2-mannosyltransferase [Fragilariopsis cylindrus CCMP1102]|eukprot:OEU08347.1 putative alpha-1,2-mannosyltransferase [Fragilariopsis cylindrus CCMP1102]
MPPSYLSSSSCWIWTFVVLPIHVGYRIALANRMPIMDCDETFNYWEVVHYLLFRDDDDNINAAAAAAAVNDSNSSNSNSGSLLGFQTWEYSNEYALRTYAYLTPLVFLARIYLQILRRSVPPSWFWSLLTDQIFDPSRSSKIAVFVTTVTNVYMYTSLWFALVGWVTEFLLISAAGTAHASAALLPSSTLMGLWLYAAAAFLRKQHGRFCVLAILATLAIGWPFGVLVLVPLGIGVLVRELVERERLMIFVFLWIIPITILVQGLVMFIDYQHYGRIVSPLWNILLYNTQAGGDELYGVEPLSYYIKNLVLNLNYVAVVGIAGILPLMWSLLVRCNSERNASSNNNKQISSSSSSTWKDGWILMVPLYLWLAVVVPRPHKEERFLYPIYPCLCLGAAIVSVSFVQGLLNHPWWIAKSQKEREQEKMTSIIPLSVFLLAMIWIPAGIISWSRTIALSRYYSAPLLLYAQIPDAISKENVSLNVVEGSDSKSSITPTVVCTCGEWYRFPSSFFIESVDSSDVIFGFAPSTFTGQLPQPFTKDGSGPPSFSSSPSSSSSTTNQFNDKNLPEPGSYMSLGNCDFLVELSTSLHSCTEQGNSSNSDIIKWQPIVQVPFFNSEATTSTLHRILYIPHLHESAIQSGEVQYSDFVLYAKK